MDFTAVSKAIADHAGDVEGLLAAPLRSVHELSMHPIPPWPRPVRVDAITWESARAESSISLRAGSSERPGGQVDARPPERESVGA